MSAPPPVTIITSTYNWPLALELAVKSALRQSMGDFEHLIIGDACTDETEDRVRAIGDPRIRWINLEINSGNQSYPNQVGLTEARGEIVAYLNHDDLWFDDHLEKTVGFLRQTKAAAVHSLCLEIAPPGNPFIGILGLPLRRDEGFGTTPMATTVVHKAEAGRTAGGWRDWRTMPDVPTLEFFGRLGRQPGGLKVLPYVTALKFNSAERPDCYVLKTADEQAEYARRMTAPEFRHEMTAKAIMQHFLGVKRPPNPFQEPAQGRNGWHIDRCRIVRGLEPMAGTAPTAPDLS